jgi:nucleoid-associated protein YgaU
MAVRTEQLIRRRPTAARYRSHQRRAAVRQRCLAAGVAAAVAAGTLLIGGSAPASRPGAPNAVIIRPGQTVWGIAERYAPEGVDIRAYIDAVTALNRLAGSLEAGDRLRLPR